MKALAAVVAAVLVVASMAWCFQLLWNFGVAPGLQLPSLSYAQAWCVWAVGRLLVGRDARTRSAP